MKFRIDLKNDKKYVLQAVKQDGMNLKHASEELKNDKEVVLEAVKQHGLYLQFASSELRDDKEVVLEAVKKNGFSLFYASSELRNDKEIVLEHVKQDGDLYYASLELRNDKEVVLEAVKQNGKSLQYASLELQKDKEILLSRNFTTSSHTFPIKFKRYRTYDILYEYSERYNTSFKDNFDDLVFHEHLGRGSYGGTYLCSSKEEKEFAVKIYNNLFAGDEKKEEILFRECLYIRPQENIVSTLEHWKNEVSNYLITNSIGKRK